MFFHVFNTWALANLFHPVLMLLFSFIESDEDLSMENLSLFLMFIFISFLISIPSLILARIFIYPIIKLNLGWQEKLVLWIIATIISILINFCAFALVFDRGVDLNDLYFLIPAAIAALLSILVRIRAFISFETEYKTIN